MFSQVINKHALGRLPVRKPRGEALSGHLEEHPLVASKLSQSHRPTELQVINSIPHLHPPCSAAASQLLQEKHETPKQLVLEKVSGPCGIR